MNSVFLHFPSLSLHANMAFTALCNTRSLLKPTTLTFPSCSPNTKKNAHIERLATVEPNKHSGSVTLKACSASSRRATATTATVDGNRSRSCNCNCSFNGHSPVAVGTTVEERLKSVASEFESLTEPIDRVKRLLDYAARLPRLGGSGRLPENRVVGCATQVWVEAEMEEESGRVRFRGDSDSEISKGFVSCLIWVLDGAEASEVLAVTAEELEAVNVGVHGKEKSRVNTWHNVLVGMQERTKALVTQHINRTVVLPPRGVVLAAAEEPPFTTLVVANRSYVDQKSELSIMKSSTDS